MRFKMQLLVVVLLAYLFAQKAQAVVLVPFFNVTVTQKTIGGDGMFNYQLDENNSFHKDFSIQTENGVGSYSTSIIPSGTKYTLLQDTPGWHVTDIKCQSNNTNISITFIENGVVINAYPYSSISCDFTSAPISHRVPVLIVPGVLGSEFNENGQKLWINLGKMATDVGDNFLDSLAFTQALSAVNLSASVGEIVRVSKLALITFDYTEGLAKELVSQGYEEGRDLFMFPYDWRYGVSGKNASGEFVNEQALAQKIQSIRSMTGSNKVDVVAHSTGGLLVKQYVKDHPQDHGIGKAVFVGVPNTGAPKAVKVLLSGDNFGIPWLADEEMRKISQNLPVLYDLAPSRMYVDRKGSFFKTIDQKLLAKDVVTQHDYDGAWGTIVNDRGANGAALAGAEHVHTALFDDYDLRSAGVDLYNIAGCRTGTIGQIVGRRTPNLFGPPDVTYDAPVRVMGDGTVPLESATNVPVDANKKYYALNTDHGKMMSQNGIRQLITNILSGSTLAMADVTQDIAACKLNGKAHAIYSPVDVVVIDQLGNRLGFASDGSVENTIPNASFEVFGDHKFFYLPDGEGQQYDIQLHGTATGTFTYKVSEVQAGAQTKTAVFADLPVTSRLRGVVEDERAVPRLLLDTDGNGTTDKTVLPSAVLAAAQGDLVAPTTTAKLTGTKGAGEFYRSAVTIALGASDAGGDVQASGVARTYLSVDDADAVPYSAPMKVVAEGKHSIAFYSVDKNANREVVKRTEFWVDTTPPELSLAFNPAALDVQFACKDLENASCTVVEKGEAVHLTDQAGNTTKVIFKQSDRKKALRAELDSITYNGKKQYFSKNSLLFFWQTDANKQLSRLYQFVANRREYYVTADYNGKNTTILSWVGSGLKRQQYGGLKVITITTADGDLVWNAE